MIVVDCSVVADLLLRPTTLDAPDPDDVWLAPSVLDTELVSAVRGHLLGRRLSPEQAAAALDDYTDLTIDIWPVDAALRRRMLSLAHTVSAYDAAYVALAEATGAPLVTRDRRLAAASPSGVTCVVA